MGRTFGLLYLSPEPLSQAELQQRLHVSVGSASMTLSALMRWGVVHKVVLPGQRREFYVAETDYWKMISGVLNRRERREIKLALERVARAVEGARTARTATRGRQRGQIDFALDRLTRLHEICRLGETMLDMLLGQLTLDVGRFRDVLRA
jgi:DNA-binding transcriptional regulator GbsR (MarR family)